MSETKFLVFSPKKPALPITLPILLTGSFLLVIQDKLGGITLTLLSHISLPVHQQILWTLLSKCVWDLTTSHHLSPLPLSSPSIIVAGSLLISVPTLVPLRVLPNQQAE